MKRRPSSEQDRALFARRALLVGGGQVLGFGLLAGRLYQLQVLERQYYAPLADNNRISVQTLPPVRGRILDRNGEVLAENEEHYALKILPNLNADLEETLDRISDIVPLSDDQKQGFLKSAKDNRNQAIIAADNLTFQQLAAINVLTPQLPGVVTQASYRRRYRGGTAMSHITGYVGEVSSRALDDDSVLRLPGMKIGKVGVELGREKELRGEAGRQKFEVNARGQVIRKLDTLDAVTGKDLQLTIDSELQSRVMARLSGERRAALVVMNVRDGALLSMASVPSYDADRLSHKLSEQEWQALSSGKDLPMFNRTIRGLYPPGSTFKMITALAALEAGEVALKESVSCSGQYTLADQTYNCWKRHGHGRMDLHRALKESCDTYFYEVAKRTGITKISETATALGLGQTFDCGLPLQKKGIIPTNDWKRWRLNASWLDGETVLAGIGQGYVSATPLQLAVMTARLATGRQVEPHLITGEARSKSKFTPLTFNKDHLRAVRAGMLASVYEPGGTGKAVQIAGANFSIAGKTGTSQVRANSTKTRANQSTWELRDHALFVCYFPVDHPRYAIACIVEHGGSGGKTAAPLVREVIKDVVDFDRTRGRAARRKTPAKRAKPKKTGEG